VGYDVVIARGKVVNGAGNPWFRADIGVKNGRIRTIGRVPPDTTEQTIDADGLVVCPGFIDAHSHSDMSIPFNPAVESTIRQGVTTLITGNCGISLAPVHHATVGLLEQLIVSYLPKDVPLTITWQTFGEYLDYVAGLDVAANVAHLVGHGTVRLAVMGCQNRPPTAEELEAMKRLVAEAMEAGALGLSTGLIYPPGMYAQTDELVALARVAARYGGVYASHVRGEGKTLVEAVREAIAIGEQSDLPVELAHHKASGRRYWGTTRDTLKMIDAARRRGLDVTFDQYPYTAGMTSLATLLPPWAHEGGVPSLLQRLASPVERRRIRRDMETGRPGWENMALANGWEHIRIGSVSTAANRDLEGKNLVEVATLRGTRDQCTALFNLLREEDGRVTMIVFSMDEAEVRRVMRHPAQMVGTDSWSVAPYDVLGGGKPHPRFYDTYPRILGRYVREEGVLPLEEAIRKMTSLPARTFRIPDRGALLEGCWADIAIFNPETIRDTATYDDPHAYPDGVEYVLVNGRVVIARGDNTGVRAGTVLRNPAS
jgi:N-acyl-D-amino-acid deacylase